MTGPLNLKPISGDNYKSEMTAASGNSFLLRTFDLIIKARSVRKFDGHREDGEVGDIVRNYCYENVLLALAAITLNWV